MGRKIRTNLEYFQAKTNNCTKNDTEIRKKITTGLEHFEVRKQITPQRTRPKLVKEQEYIQKILRLKSK